MYFCSLEALQNIAKHAQASRATISLAERDGCLEFSIKDDGVGLDPSRARSGSGMQNMSDRVAALGGSLEVQGSAGKGTTISGRLPIP